MSSERSMDDPHGMESHADVLQLAKPGSHLAILNLVDDYSHLTVVKMIMEALVAEGAGIYMMQGQESLAKRFMPDNLRKHLKIYPKDWIDVEYKFLPDRLADFAQKRAQEAAATGAIQLGFFAQTSQNLLQMSNPSDYVEKGERWTTEFALGTGLIGICVYKLSDLRLRGLNRELAAIFLAGLFAHSNFVAITEGGIIHSRESAFTELLKHIDPGDFPYSVLSSLDTPSLQAFNAAVSGRFMQMQAKAEQIVDENVSQTQLVEGLVLALDLDRGIIAGTGMSSEEAIRNARMEHGRRRFFLWYLPPAEPYHAYRLERSGCTAIW